MYCFLSGVIFHIRISHVVPAHVDGEVQSQYALPPTPAKQVPLPLQSGHTGRSEKQTNN